MFMENGLHAQNLRDLSIADKSSLLKKSPIFHKSINTILFITALKK